MVSGLYEFKMEHALFSETGLSGNTGHTSNLMEPFTDGLDVMDDKCQWKFVVHMCESWLCDPCPLEATIGSYLLPFLSFSLACTPAPLLILRPSLVSSAVPVIWNNGEGGPRFIRVDK